MWEGAGDRRALASCLFPSPAPVFRHPHHPLPATWAFYYLASGVAGALGKLLHATASPVETSTWDQLIADTPPAYHVWLHPNGTAPWALCSATPCLLVSKVHYHNTGIAPMRRMADTVCRAVSGGTKGPAASGRGTTLCKACSFTRPPTHLLMRWPHLVRLGG
jgi:hypothetical protein